MCLKSIWANEWKASLDIYIVDNSSTDGSMAVLEREWGTRKDFHILYMEKNLGFSAANNAGIRRALSDGADSVILLNNDTVLCRDMLSKLVAAQQRYGMTCIIVPKICYYDRPEIIWSAGGGFSRIIKKSFSFGMNQLDDGTFDKEGQCENGNGCCILLSREVIERVGLWDERFFLYYEDTEYFMRAGEKGIPVYYVPSAKLYHKVNGSTKGNENPLCVYYITRNWLICNKRHLHGVRFLLFLLYFVLNRLVWIGIWVAQGKFAQVGAVMKGAEDFMKKRIGPMC